MQPLVSVLICAYNCAATLKRALASLVAQTYESWEAVVVDDGSSDDPQSVVRAITDHRIRFFRFENNSGRGVARQFALTKARGKYVAFLDADDWLYPCKIDEQIEVMEDEPSLVLCSSPVAIANSKNCITGIRLSPANGEEGLRTFRARPAWVPVPFASSLIKTNRAQKIGFDESFKRSEDFDFLLRLLWGQRFFLMSSVTYVYVVEQEVTSNTSLRAAQETLRFNRKVARKFADDFPILSRFMALQCLGMLAKTRVRRFLGIRFRDPEPSPEHVANFEQAREIVAKQQALLFGPE
jgi:glycosyltransferase involved in cell wall biosynthesis